MCTQWKNKRLYRCGKKIFVQGNPLNEHNIPWMEKEISSRCTQWMNKRFSRCGKQISGSTDEGNKSLTFDKSVQKGCKPYAGFSPLRAVWFHKKAPSVKNERCFFFCFFSWGLRTWGHIGPNITFSTSFCCLLHKGSFCQECWKVLVFLFSLAFFPAGVYCKGKNWISICPLKAAHHIFAHDSFVVGYFPDLKASDVGIVGPFWLFSVIKI